MARGKKTDDATRAAVMAALLAGMGISEISREYHLPIATVGTLKATIDAEKLERLRKADARASEAREESFDSLWAGVLRANLRAITNIANTAANPEYTERQEASQLATLVSTIADKTIRIFEAVAAAGDESAGV